MGYLESLFSYPINLEVDKVQRLLVCLPILIIFAFPLLYFGGHSDSSLYSIGGIVVLFLGMSGPLIKRVI